MGGRPFLGYHPTSGQLPESGPKIGHAWFHTRYKTTTALFEDSLRISNEVGWPSGVLEVHDGRLELSPGRRLVEGRPSYGVAYAPNNYRRILDRTCIIYIYIYIGGRTVLSLKPRLYNPIFDDLGGCWKDLRGSVEKFWRLVENIFWSDLGRCWKDLEACWKDSVFSFFRFGFVNCKSDTLHDFNMSL